MTFSIKTLFGFKQSQPLPAGTKNKTSTAKKQVSILKRLILAGDRLAFAWPVREALFRHLSTQVSNGIPVETALDAFRIRLQRRKKVSSAKIIALVVRSMRNGSTLASALSPWIPQNEVSVVSSGELSGNLPRSLDLLIETKRRIARVNSALKTAMVSPIVYCLAVYALLWATGNYVTPGLQQALPKEQARGLVAFFYVASDFAASGWAILPPVLLIGGVLMILHSFPVWTGRYRLMAEHTFPYSFYRDIQGYTWLMSFSALLRAGMTDVDIFKRQAAQATPWLRERLQLIGWRMGNGASLPEALMAKGRNGLLPLQFPSPELIDDIVSMAGFADFPERIAKLAVQWAEELEMATLARTRVVGFAMEMVMYAIMGLLMVAINSMSTQLASIPAL